MHSCTWRVGDDDVGSSMLCDEVVCQDVLHIACIEERILDIVYLRVDFGIFDSLRHVFDSYYLLGFVCHKVGYGSCSCIEVVHEFSACKVGKLACHAVQVVSLFGIGLIETLWSDLELQVFHQLKDMVVALEEAQLQIVEGVVALLIVHVHE